MQTTLSYRHRAITDDDLVFIRKLIAEHPGSSRHDLSLKLCRAWNWVQANGALRDMVCRGLMLMLHRQGLIELPAVRCVNRNPLVERSPPVLVRVDETALRVSFAELGALQVRQVRRTPEEALFNSLLAQHHYLGYSVSFRQACMISSGVPAKFSCMFNATRRAADGRGIEGRASDGTWREPGAGGGAVQALA